MESMNTVATGENSEHDMQRHNELTASQPYVLIIEDDEAFGRGVSIALQQFGYPTLVARTVREAEIAMGRYGPMVIRIVISDIHLTGSREVTEGYILYQQWIAAYPTLAYLLMSGDEAVTTLPDICTGQVPFLLKPFRFSLLKNIVSVLLNQDTI